MKKELITTTFYKSHFDQLEELEKKMVNLAIKSMESAYAPYSGFLVGSSILLENDEIIYANNQENVAYPSGLCAERVAIYYAGSRFPGVKINKIVVTARSDRFNIEGTVSPCGSCRQTISEYEVKQDNNIKILLHQTDNSILIFDSIADLLPMMFISEGLKRF